LIADRQIQCVRTIAALLCLTLLATTSSAALAQRGGGNRQRARATARIQRGEAQSQSRGSRDGGARVDARFLGNRPIGPLAIVRSGRIVQPEDAACRTLGPVGSRWRELDGYGRIAAEVVVSAKERYDITNCDELSVRRLQGRRGAGVFVSADALYAPP